jgi:hypothetical protein
MTDPADLAEKQDAILRRRAIEATWAVIWAVGSAELMFAAFAIGSSFGPTPLRPVEILFGSTVFFLSGAILSFRLARRRQERGAHLRARVREGRKEHRVVVFDDHLMIGSEVVLKEALTSAELDDRGLVLRYRDPRYEGAVLRELTGERRVLEEIHKVTTQLGFAGGGLVGL